MKTYIRHTSAERGSRRLAGADRLENGSASLEPLDRFLFPLNLAYASPLPNVFLWRLKRLSELNAEREWLVRDGLMPLLWFFYKNPRPERGFKPRLVVHEALAAAVPAAWKKHCSLYRHALSTPQAKSRAPRAERAVTCLIASPLFCSQEHLTRRLREAKLPKGDLLAWAAMRDGLFSTDADLTMSFRLVQELSRAVRGEVLVRPWYALSGSSYYGDAIYLDLNQRLLCADDTAFHAFVSKGARPASAHARPATKKERRLPVSDHHDLVISKFHSERVGQSPQAFLETTYEFLPSLRHPTNEALAAQLPWPGWITEYAMWWSRR